VLAHAARGTQLSWLPKRGNKDLDEDTVRERLGLSFGELLAQSNALISKTEVRVKE